MDTDGLSELGRAAVWYAERGFGVFPLLPRGKRPATAHGVNDWTDNPADVRAWWLDHPDHNIGIACGTPSGGLLALDFDVDEEKDKDGAATLREWEAAYGELPETAVAITGGGGMHYLYRTDRTNIRPSVNAALGVDVRSDGSYIVAPPSMHENGRRYEWQDPPDETPIATATGAVYDFLDHVQRNGGTDGSKKDNGKFRLPDSIRKGERDNTLYKYACHLRGIGRSDEEILASVAGVNAMRCDPPMDSREVERIVRSACRYDAGPNGGAGDKADKPPAQPRPADEVEGIRGPRGGLMTNRVAQVVMERNMARIIDGAPAIWTGRRWEFGTRAINRAVLDIADDAKKQDKSEVVSYIMDRAPSVSSDSSFDGRYYAQFSNCTYDVLGRCAVEPRPEMYIVATLPVELDMDMGPNLADEFLESISGGDAVVREALMEVVGACVCSKRAVSQSPMLIGRAGGSDGKASNGKSTFINWLRSILGTENVSSLDIATLGERFQAGRVLGKLANLGDDIPDGFLQGDQLSTFKKLVTGDAIYTDVKNSDGFEFRTSATMVFSMNAIPRLSDTTEGVFRRLYFLPFRRRFTEGEPGYDPGIASKLSAPEVLRRGALLGLMGLEKLLRRGHLPAIPDMEREMDEVRQDNDSVVRWLYDEDVSRADIDGQKVADVYKMYVEWCHEAGERNPCAMRTFSGRVIDAQKFKSCSLKTANKRYGDKVLKTFFVEDCNL